MVEVQNRAVLGNSSELQRPPLTKCALADSTFKARLIDWATAPVTSQAAAAPSFAIDGLIVPALRRGAMASAHMGGAK